MKFGHLLGAVLAVTASAAIAAPAMAQDWPDGPIQVVVPFGAGGDTDFNARVLSKYLEPKLGVSMPVVNITGAGGTIAARQVMGAEPDGQTVLFFNTSFLASTASQMVDFGFDDFEMVAIVAEEPGTVISVPADAPYSTMEELVAATQADPGSIDLTANTGATTYLVGQQLNNAGAEFNFVDVGGAAGRLTAILGGNVDVSQNPVGQVLPYAENGELKVLATLARERSDAMPDVPTLRELGYDIDLQLEYFYLFPEGTPQEAIDRFANALEEVVTQNEAYAEEIYEAYYQKPHFLDAEAATERLNEVFSVMEEVDF